MKRFEDFSKRLPLHDERVDALGDFADRMKAANHYAGDEVGKAAKGVKDR